MRDTAPPTSCTERAHLTLNLVNLRPQVAFVRGQRRAICRESLRVASSAPCRSEGRKPPRRRGPGHRAAPGAEGPQDPSFLPPPSRLSLSLSLFPAQIYKKT